MGSDPSPDDDDTRGGEEKNVAATEDADANESAAVEDPILQQEVCWKCKGHGKKLVKNHPLPGGGGTSRRQRKKQAKLANSEKTPNDDGKKAAAGSPHRYVGAECTVCGGTGKRPASQRSLKLSLQPGKIQALRGRDGVFAGLLAAGSSRRPGWNDLSPPKDDPTGLVGTGELMASLGCGNWRIFQLANGHKLTVDDFVCAWIAAEEARKRGFVAAASERFGQPPPEQAPGDDDDGTPPAKKPRIQQGPEFFRHADIGCGCGSVLMTLLWAFPGAIRSHGVEAQEVSFGLCQRGLSWNLGDDNFLVVPPDGPEEEETAGTAGVPSGAPASREDPIARLTHQDLRSWRGGASSSSSLAPFDLVTGTPPYFPQDRFVASENHAQKIRCRVPTRGAASDYLLAAARLIRRKDKESEGGGRNGVIVLVETARKEAEQELLDTLATKLPDLRVDRRLDVVTRQGLPPRFSCWVVSPREQSTPTNDTTTATEPDSSFPVETLTIRNADGSRTLQYVDALEAMGWVDFERTRDKKAAAKG